MKKIAIFAVLLASFMQTNGMILNCSYKLSNYSIFQDIYSCNAQAIFLTENDDEIQFVIQNQHIKGKKNSDVTGFNLTNQELPAHKIPSNLNVFFPNLKVLDLKNTMISQLKQEEISPFQKLEVLILWSNLIKILDGNVFAQNSALIYIDFESNMLTNTGTKLLEPLTQLKYAYFGKNICTDIYVNNATESTAAKFKVQLSSNCPPSFDMLVGEILENSEFLAKISSLIEDKISAQQPDETVDE